MIKVYVTRDITKAISGFEIKGHANFDIKGKDIVCAAVSAIAYTALGGLKNLAKIDFEHTESNGTLECNMNSYADVEAKNKASVILETMVIGLRQVEKAYPENVEVVDKEVH